MNILHRIALVSAAVTFTFASTITNRSEIVELLVLLTYGAFSLWFGLGFLHKTDEAPDSNEQKINEHHTEE